MKEDLLSERKII